MHINALHVHERIMARFLEKRGWVVFYLEDQARSCNAGTCWLNLYKGETMRKRNKGVTVVEYAVLLALIAIAVAVAAPNITSAIVGVFGNASSVIGKDYSK